MDRWLGASRHEQTTVYIEAGGPASGDLGTAPVLGVSAQRQCSASALGVSAQRQRSASSAQRQRSAPVLGAWNDTRSQACDLAPRRSETIATPARSRPSAALPTAITPLAGVALDARPWIPTG